MKMNKSKLIGWILIILGIVSNFFGLAYCSLGFIFPRIYVMLACTLYLILVGIVFSVNFKSKKD